jgi:hypothetical protein
MKRTPPPLATGYRLKVSRVFDDREQKHKTRFTLETLQSFASFVYELSTQERRKGNDIHFKVLGLKPPRLSLSASGPARFQRDYEDLIGSCEVTIENIDGNRNAFKFRISKDKVEVLQSPQDGFTEFVVESHQTPTK